MQNFVAALATASSGDLLIDGDYQASYGGAYTGALARVRSLQSRAG